MDFFGAGGPFYYLLILVFLAGLLALYLWGNRHNKTDKAGLLQVIYQDMTEEKLAGVADDELVEAVVSNMMAKLDRKRPDPYKTIPLLSPGRCAVYGVWLLCHELDEGDFESLLSGPSGVFLELGADGFERVGAPRCAGVLRAVLGETTDGEGEDDIDSDEDDPNPVGNDKEEDTIAEGDGDEDGGEKETEKDNDIDSGEETEESGNSAVENNDSSEAETGDGKTQNNDSDDDSGEDADEKELAERHADFLEAMESEQPLQKCVTYIRDNPDEFVDD